MKKYTKPELTVTEFECEDVMTLSATNTMTYDAAEGENPTLTTVDVGNQTSSLVNPFM